jgi:hypothetical protein
MLTWPRCACAADALQAARKIVNAIIHPDTGARGLKLHACAARAPLTLVAPVLRRLLLFSARLGEKVFLPLRLSFIVPCNLMLDTLMMSARGSAQVVAAQTLNQTYNALHYRANRNATAAAEDGWQVAQVRFGAPVRPHTL